MYYIFHWQLLVLTNNVKTKAGFFFQNNPDQTLLSQNYMRIQIYIVKAKVKKCCPFRQPCAYSYCSNFNQNLIFHSKLILIKLDFRIITHGYRDKYLRPHIVNIVSFER